MRAARLNDPRGTFNTSDSFCMRHLQYEHIGGMIVACARVHGKRTSANDIFRFHDETHNESLDLQRLW